MKHTLLLAVERGLLTLGLLLGAWSAAVLVEARYFRDLPLPEVSEANAATLPADDAAVSTQSARGPATGTWVARFEAPSVQLSATVLEGTDDATLRKAAGHIEGTALPGRPGNVGIAGHRDTIFRRVRNLRVGDPIELTTRDRVYRYRIAKTTIVNPEDVYVLDPTKQPSMTLVTCYPFEYIGHAPKRYIIHADLVGEAPRAAPTSGRRR